MNSSRRNRYKFPHARSHSFRPSRRARRTLDHLQKALSLFTTHLRYHTRASWAWHSTSNKPADFATPPRDLSPAATQQLIIEAIEAIEYTDSQDAHESCIDPGIIVLAEDSIPLAEELNRLKRVLAKVLREMQDRTEICTLNPATGERGPRPLREVALEAFFRSLHHWQATRELTILRTKAGRLTSPDYIGFTWSSCRDVRRTTRETLLDQLKEKRLTGDDSPCLASFARHALAARPLSCGSAPLTAIAPGWLPKRLDRSGMRARPVD